MAAYQNFWRQGELEPSYAQLQAEQNRVFGPPAPPEPVVCPTVTKSGRDCQGAVTVTGFCATHSRGLVKK